MFKKRVRTVSEDAAFLQPTVESTASKAFNAIKAEVETVACENLEQQPRMAPKTLIQVQQVETVASFVTDNDRDDSIGQIQHWLRKDTKPLLVIGAHGSGVTHLLASCVVSEVYDDQDLPDFLAPCGLRRRVPAMIDDIEGLDTKERQQIKAVFGTNHRRLILTATDSFSEPAKAWSRFCTVVRIDRPKKTFIAKVLALKCNDAEVCSDVAESCNGNMAAAVQAISMILRSPGECSFSVPDAVSDTMKTVGLLLGGTRVPCGGGTSDTSFVGQLLQINTPSAATTLDSLVKATERWSYFDLVDSQHILDAESQWHMMSLTALQGPKMPKDRFWRMEWPRSTKAKAKLDYEYVK